MYRPLPLRGTKLHRTRWTTADDAEKDGSLYQELTIVAEKLRPLYRREPAAFGRLVQAVGFLGETWPRPVHSTGFLGRINLAGTLGAVSRRAMRRAAHPRPHTPATRSRYDDLIRAMKEDPCTLSP